MTVDRLEIGFGFRTSPKKNIPDWEQFAEDAAWEPHARFSLPPTHHDRTKWFIFRPQIYLGFSGSVQLFDHICTRC